MLDHEYTKWVGLVEVAQEPNVNVLGAGRGAHVTAVAWCQSVGHFRSVVAKSLSEQGLKFMECEDVETCEERMRHYAVGVAFVAAIDEVGPATPVFFMDFHTFPIDDKMRYPRTFEATESQNGESQKQ